MPLPFLRHKQAAGIIMERRKADGSAALASEPEPAEGDSDQGLMACASDLMNAVHAKDAKGVAAAMRAAFALLESEPYEENGNSFEEMNEKAVE